MAESLYVYSHIRQDVPEITGAQLFYVDNQFGVDAVDIAGNMQNSHQAIETLVMMRPMLNLPHADCWFEFCVPLRIEAAGSDLALGVHIVEDSSERYLITLYGYDKVGSGVRIWPLTYDLATADLRARGPLDQHLTFLAVTVLCVVAMMNSPKVTSVQKVAMLTRLKKKGVHKAARSYVTKISLHKTIRDDKQMEADAAKTPRNVHLVRGHFKLTKAGWRWWRPFIRGAAGELQRSHYSL